MVHKQNTLLNECEILYQDSLALCQSPYANFLISSIYQFFLGDVEHVGFKLLGLKWLPVLTQLQAQELSPYEVGEPLFHSSLDILMSSPALVCALKRKDASACLRKLLPYDYPGNLSVLISSTLEVTYRQASLFFKHEMIYGKIVDCCMLCKYAIK